MNKERRKALNEIIEQLKVLRDEVESLKYEEEYYYDAMPEGIQNSEKGEKAEAAIEALNSALDSIDETVSSIEEAIE